MTAEEIAEFVRDNLDKTVVVVASEANGAPEVAWGDTFFIYDRDGTTPPDRQFPFATIVINDYPGFDDSSQLNRDGVFRLNMWVSRQTFDREIAPGDSETTDFTVLDKVIPHPVYGKQSWLSMLNPGESSGDRVKALLTEAHSLARARYDRRNEAPHRGESA